MTQMVGNTIDKFKQFTGVNETHIGSTTLPKPFPVIDSLDKIPYYAQTSTDINYIIQHRFDERKALKKKVCLSDSYKYLLNKVDYLKGPISRLGWNRIQWCRIPKIGTTYLKGLEKRLLRAIAKSSGNYASPSKSLLMVREPYSRLVSAYLGKLVSNTPWQRSLGAEITRKFRPLASHKSKWCGHDVTFPEFLKYVVEADTTGWMSNIHFTPIHQQCNPCGFDYDYIGHLETIKDDLSYILKSVNISVDMDFSDEELTSRNKARAVIRHRDPILLCEPMCSALSKVWWTFHARGLISTDIPFPLKEEQCNTINETEFSDLVWDAHTQSAGRINKPKQRRDALVTLYLQAPLPDRFKVQEVMRKDFEIYGYDPHPDDLFPELKQNR